MQNKGYPIDPILRKGTRSIGQDWFSLKGVA